MVMIECPVCLRNLDWEQAPLVTMGEDLAPTPLVLPPDEAPAATRMRLGTAYRTCPGRGGHYLPADYGDMKAERITVGMIGNSAAGKSHLLAAMIGQFMRGIRLRQLDLQVSPLDLLIHKRYVQEAVTPFLDQRKELDRTRVAAAEITDAFLVANLAAGKRYTVTFFDVAGEQLGRAGAEENLFLGAVNALIFVVDPGAVRGLVRAPAGSGVNAGAVNAGAVDAGEGGTAGDYTFDNVLKLLRLARDEAAAEFLGVPAAVVVTKADLLRRGDLLLERWLRAEADEDLDLSTVEEESGDVFTYLYTHGADRWLEPAQQCIWSTLHFASAAGTSPRDKVFPEESFRPFRVIKPLLSLLAMKGVIDSRNAAAGGPGQFDTGVPV
ncbi:MAG: hypothetical protein JO345_20015 [Streptosporangiaceae bacterium]|nr:hypothetical protein [Streptosporangiaceae bacterium]